MSCGTSVFELSDYQIPARDFLLSSKFAGLFDAPGVGKTAPAIRAGWERHVETGLPILVTAPPYLLENWAWEISRFAPGATVSIANGSGAAARHAALQADTDFVLNGYSNWSAKISEREAKAREQYGPGDIETYGTWQAAQPTRVKPARAGDFQYPELNDRPWGALIFDEAHRLRGRNSQSTRHVFELRKRKSPNHGSPIWCLTGTPIVNNPGDLYTLLHLWVPASYKSYWSFVGEWCRVVKTPWATEVGQLRKGLEDEFQDLVGEFSIRRTLKDIPSLADLEQRDRDYMVSLPPSVVKMFHKAREEYILEHEDLRGTEFVSGGGALYARLRQLGTLPPTAEKPKVDFCLEFLEDRTGPVVIYTWYKDSARGVADALSKSKRPVTLITGDVPASWRSEMVSKWSNEPNGVLVATISSLKEGISLVHATDVVFLEHSELPADQEQCVARLKRRGQTDLVNVHHVWARNSPDMAIKRALNERNLGLKAALTTWLQTGE